MVPWNVSADYYGIRYEKVTEKDLLERPRPGTYVMSTHFLIRARMWAHRDAVNSDWLDRYTPLDRIGYSLYVYRFE